jgi:DNA (cytosine-5)-methyltransferase 1
MKWKILDLFSGLGGFSLGLERTGHFKTIAFCDNDKYCNLVLQKHWKGVKIYNDVKEITKERLEADGIESPNIITGGFPCQSFSVAGKQKGTDDPRYLWPEMFRIIKIFKSKFVIGENVRGIVNIQNGMVFETVCSDLESEGYEVQPFLIPAAGVGAPHRRERIFFIAIREDMENSRRTLQQGTELREKNEDETRKENADQHQRSGSPSESNVANATSKRLERQLGSQLQGTREGSTNGGKTEVPARENNAEHQSWWQSEPNVDRVAHGVSGRIHRLKALGNSIVPQIVKEIGYAIIKAAERK